MKRVAAIVVCALSLMVATQVRADAVVHVKVRSADNKPVDGRVELSGHNQSGELHAALGARRPIPRCIQAEER
jgi:hypothetical protein